LGSSTISILSTELSAGSRKDRASIAAGGRFGPQQPDQLLALRPGVRVSQVHELGQERSVEQQVGGQFRLVLGLGRGQAAKRARQRAACA
jgi:hypothetical protein